MAWRISLMEKGVEPAFWSGRRVENERQRRCGRLVEVDALVVGELLGGGRLQAEHVHVHAARLEIPGGPIDVEGLEEHALGRGPGLVMRGFVGLRSRAPPPSSTAAGASSVIGGGSDESSPPVQALRPMARARTRRARPKKPIWPSGVHHTTRYPARCPGHRPAPSDPATAAFGLRRLSSNVPAPRTPARRIPTTTQRGHGTEAPPVFVSCSAWRTSGELLDELLGPRGVAKDVAEPDQVLDIAEAELGEEARGGHVARVVEHPHGLVTLARHRHEQAGLEEAVVVGTGRRDRGVFELDEHVDIRLVVESLNGDGLPARPGGRRDEDLGRLDRAPAGEADLLVDGAELAQPGVRPRHVDVLAA